MVLLYSISGLRSTSIWWEYRSVVHLFFSGGLGGGGFPGLHMGSEDVDMGEIW